MILICAAGANGCLLKWIWTTLTLRALPMPPRIRKGPRKTDSLRNTDDIRLEMCAPGQKVRTVEVFLRMISSGT